MYAPACLAVVCLFVTGAHGVFRMEIEPAVAQVGDEVTLKCIVADEEDPRVPFEWFRRDTSGHHEILGLNRLLTHPYLEKRAAGPFVILQDYDVEESTTTFYAKFTAAQLEDNASYGCDLINSRGDATALTVALAPSEVLLYGSNSPLTPSSVHNVDPFGPNQILRITPTSTGHFMCVAEGFLPEPTITIDFDGTELTHFEAERSSSVVVSETNPDYTYTVHNVFYMSTAPLSMRMEYSRKALTCTASVPGLEPVSANVRPVLRVPPTITCSDTTVPSGSKQVKLSCIIDADPECTTIEWSWTMAGGNKLTVASGEVLDAKYKSTHEVLDDGTIETSMYFEHVWSEMFKTYKVFAENEIGDVTGQPQLIRDIDAEIPSASSGLFSSGCLLICAVITAWQRLL